MAKRALIIGSQTFGLAGVEADVALMAETLSARGFAVALHTGDGATRAAILGAYEQLIDDTPPGSTDAVVVYYSGHGGRIPLPGWQELQHAGKRSHLHFIVPSDMAASTETDFRGILAEELSDLQRRLTARTENVTTILDCCHSATMSRDPDVFPKAVARDFPPSAAVDLLAALDAEAAARATELDTSNRLAVRVVACDPVQSAYERESSLGGRHGALTEQLVIALREIGDRPVSWRVLGDRIRRSVTSTLPMQRPEIEGPADRLPFSLARRRAADALPVVVTGDAAAIPSARLFGLAVGDEFRLIADDETELGTATVESLDRDRAKLTVERTRAGRPLPADVSALPVRTASRRAVRLDLPAASSAAVGARIEQSPLLRLAGDHDAEAPVASIGDQGGLTVADGTGLAVTDTPLPADDAGIGKAVSIAERIAKAERLRGLASGSGDKGKAAGSVVVELASHDGATVPRKRAGERLYVGERISVSITNAADETLYVALFDIDTSYRVTLVSSDEPAGWRLAPGEAKVVGGDAGVALAWDDDVPRSAERLETLLVVAANAPQQFGLLETPPDAGARGTGLSDLEALLVEASSGTRGWPATAGGGQATRYRAEAIDFYLVPGPKPNVDEPPFAISELPDPSQRSVQPRALGDVPKRVAVRLVALKVRNNKALFRSAVRLDALVITSNKGRGCRHAVHLPLRRDRRRRPAAHGQSPPLPRTGSRLPRPRRVGQPRREQGRGSRPALRGCRHRPEDQPGADRGWRTRDGRAPGRGGSRGRRRDRHAGPGREQSRDGGGRQGDRALPDELPRVRALRRGTSAGGRPARGPGHRIRLRDRRRGMTVA